MDLYWRESLIVPTEAEYIEMVNNSAYFLWFRRRTIETDIKLELTRNWRIIPDSNQIDDGSFFRRSTAVRNILSLSLCRRHAESLFAFAEITYL